MSTIKDVAKLAGVSLGTVSNVLNGKKAVNPERARRVQDAIDSLNYKPHQTARSLKTSKTMNIAVVLPDILDPMKANLFSGIERVLSQQGYAVSLFTTADVAAKETAIIERILEQRADGIIISTCQPENYQIFKQLKNSDTSIVLLERAVAGEDFQLVEFDNYNSIFKLTNDLISGGTERNILIAGTHGLTSEDLCVSAFTNAYKEQGLEPIGILRTGFNKENSFKTITRYLQTNELPENIITTGTPLMTGVLKALEMQALGDELKPGLYSLSEENWAEINNSGFYRIPRRPIALGEAAAELLLAEIKSERPIDLNRLKISNSSLKMKQINEFSVSHKGHTLEILMFDSPAFRAVKSLTPDFEKKYGSKVNFTALNYEEISSAMADEEARSRFDVFQIDIPWLSDLVRAGSLLELGIYKDEIKDISKEFVPGVLSSYSIFNKGIYALPFMFGTQLLYYRKDLFEDPSLKLRFKEKYGFDLRAPKTWTEFNMAAEFFTKSLNPESPIEYGTTLGGEMTSGAVCEFLPRLWSYGGSILDDDGRISHDRSTLVKALDVYKESFKYANSNSSEYWWDEQVSDFKAGKAAMMIMFIAHAVDLVDASDSIISGKIGYDLIPGGIPMLGGWSIGINSATKKADDAFDFVRWAVSKELAIPQTILGGSTASISLYKSSELLTIYPWLPKALESFNSCRKRDVSMNTTSGKLSDQDFERILGKAVHEAIVGLKSNEEAIESALTKISKLL